MRDAVRCDYTIGEKQGLSPESQAWFWEHIPIFDRSIAGIRVGKSSGARTALTLRAVLPFFTHEVPQLMRDLAVAASQHVELTLQDKESAGIISSVFSDFAALLCQEWKQGEDYVAAVLAFLAVENIRPCLEQNSLRVGLMFPEEKPILPRTHRLDLRLTAWKIDKFSSPING